MTADEFRQLALSLPESTASQHMNHPDFRVQNKVFATLGYPDDDWGMIKLTAEQQSVFVHSHPGIFQPVKGGWGRKGATNVRLTNASPEIVLEAMAIAWRNVGPVTLVQHFDDV